QVSLHIGPPQTEQGPADQANLGAHRTEPGHAGASNEPQQKSLNLVIGRMAREDGAGALAARDTPQEVVANFSRGGFERELTLALDRHHIAAGDGAAKAEALRKIAHKLSVGL